MSYERPHLRMLTGYVPGALPRASSVKLNTNENPYPPSPLVAAALSSLSPNMLRRYPDPRAQGFREAAARLHHLSADHVVATNGGDELLRLALTTYLDPGRPLGLLTPSYSLYSVLAAIHEAPVAAVPLPPDWSLPPKAAEQWNAAGAPLAIVTNPHAPSGTLISIADLERLAAGFHGVLLLDEAYVDFVDPDIGHDTSALIEAHPNVLLLRTLSKGHSLAGIRLAYGLGVPDLVAPMLSKTKDSYNVDVLAQIIGTSALSDTRSAAQSWEAVRASRRQLMRDLNALGLWCSPSQANFLLAAVPLNDQWPSAQDLYQALMVQGAYVRWFDQDRLRDKLRITIGTPEENAYLLETLGRLVSASHPIASTTPESTTTLARTIASQKKCAVGEDG
jgi:histidinol-phosphate aminotransferase